MDGQVKEHTFVEGDLADLMCLVDADPKPDIQWLWQGKPMDLDSPRYSLFRGIILDTIPTLKMGL